MRRAFLAAAIGAGMSAAPGSAQASDADTTVVTVPVEVRGELGADWRLALDAGVADGLARGKFNVVAATTGCPGLDKRCLTTVAADNDARYLVRTEVTAEDRNYTVTLSLVDGATGDTKAQASDVCEICGLQQVRKLVADGAATLRTKLDALVAGAPVAVITSVPDGATIKIDGQTVGQTPVRSELTPGRHLARAELPGHITVERQFEAVGGVEERMEFELPAAPDLRPRLAPWGWVGVGVGAASIAAGVTFWVLDERPAPGDRCRGDNVDASGQCRFRYDTLAPGLVLTAAGAVLSLAGTAVLVTLRTRRPRRRSVSWRPTPSGLGVRF